MAKGPLHEITQIALVIILSIFIQVLKDDLKLALSKSPYYSIFVDGSVDISNIEMELIYIMYIADGEPTMKFLVIKAVKHANAEGIVKSVKESLREFNIEGKSIVAFCSDGASVNMGRRGGVATLLKEDAPWLIVIHCLNHVLELAARDAFKDTGVEMVTQMLNSLYSIYHRSAKRWRELEEVIL